MSESMFLCLECGALFEQPKHITERHGLDTPPFEEQEVCPLCSGMVWRETFRCNGCGEYVSGQYVEVPTGERFCESCYTLGNAADE